MLAACRQFLRRLSPKKAPVEARIEQLFLLHSPTAALLQFTARRHQITPAQRRDIAITITYLLSFLRDKHNREQLLAQGHMSVDGVTYAFRIQGPTMLLGVIVGEQELTVALEALDAILHDMHREHAAILHELSENPGTRLPKLIPDLS